MSRLVLGIGNPGFAYSGTRHNVGFAVLDRLAESCGVQFRKASAFHMEAEVAGGRLVKPTTYVNRSGQALSACLEQESITSEEFLVVVDDIHLDPGRIRFRQGGSDGGHNGLKDLQRAWGSQDFARLRIGVGASGGGGQKLVDHVLGVFDESETEIIVVALDRAVEGIREFLNGQSMQGLMAKLNRAAKDGPANKER